jgi:putative ABC transport system permease protein
VRGLSRNWGLNGIAILSLAIGIGANSAIFSAVDVFMLRPLPYPDSGRLHMIWIANQQRGWVEAAFAVPDFVDLRDRSQSMHVAGIRNGTFNLAGTTDAERVDGQYVTPGFFEVLGVQPAAGRAFSADEGRPGGDRVAIISDGLWKRRFAADPGVLGSTIVLDGAPHTIVGIMPPRFWFRQPGREIWVPLAIAGDERRDAHNLAVLARVSDDVSASMAAEEAQRIMGQIGRDHPDTSAGHGAVMVGLHEDVFNEGFQAGTSISTVAVFVLLLIACANVANLLLTQAAGRSRDLAVRTALGASRSRIVRLLFSEAAVISVLGGVLGLGLAAVGIRGLVSIMPPFFPRVHEIGLSPRVLAFTAFVTMLTAVISGLAPALQTSRPDLTGMLKEGARGGDVRGTRVRKAMVVVEVALALVLVVSSALLVQGFVRIRMADRGFDASDVLTLQTLLPEDQYRDADSVNDFYTRLSARLASLPGVTAVGGTSMLPTQGDSQTYYVREGEDFNDQAQRRLARARFVLPGYFDSLDVPVLLGRGIEDSDRRTSRQVVVVNKAFADRHWPGGDAVGARIVAFRTTWDIVGVVANTRDHPTSAGGEVFLFFPAAQVLARYMSFTIEASVPLETLVEPVRAELRSIDPTIPAYDLMPFPTLMDQSLGGDTIMAKIMGAVALIALVLALGGVYGVMAHSVSQRTREIGIRASLGARRTDLVSMIVRQGMRLALLAVVLGSAAALAATRGLARFLFGVSPFDPATFGGAAAMLLLAALVATIFPALRAARVDPIEALRTE